MILPCHAHFQQSFPHQRKACTQRWPHFQKITSEISITSLKSTSQSPPTLSYSRSLIDMTDCPTAVFPTYLCCLQNTSTNTTPHHLSPYCWTQHTSLSKIFGKKPPLPTQFSYQLPGLYHIQKSPVTSLSFMYLDWKLNCYPFCDIYWSMSDP